MVKMIENLVVVPKIFVVFIVLNISFCAKAQDHVLTPQYYYKQGSSYYTGPESIGTANQLLVVDPTSQKLVFRNANEMFSNLYTSDGTLTGNRTANLNGNNLVFYGLGNIGFNVANPTEKLDVGGNVKFSGALMPNNVSGISGQVLVSSGANTPPVWINPTSLTSANIYNNDGTLTGNRIVNQGSNSLTFGGTGRTIVSGGFQTQGLLYAKPPRVHPIATSITWQADDVVILLQSTHSGSIVFPSASANPNRLIGINNRSGSARIIANVTGGDTGIYADEALSQIASNSGVSWFVSDGISWRLYSGRP